MGERAKSMIRHPVNYTKATHESSASYIKNIAFNKYTCEIVDGRSMKLNEEKIREVTRKYSCVQINPNLYQFLYYDEILEAYGKMMGIEFNNKCRIRL